MNFVNLRAFVITVVAGVAVVAAQEAPTFEVASIKINNSNDGGQFIRMLPGNRFNATNMPARQLIVMSYQLQQFQLAGGPSWLTSERYDIVGKLAGEEAAPFVPGQPNPYLVALRSLLTERFKLKIHKETREMDVYNLVMIKPGVPGPALKPSTTDCAALARGRRNTPPAAPPAPPGPNEPMQCGIMGGPGLIRVGGQPIGQISQMLTGQTGRLVFDKTDLKGNWDFTLKYQFEGRGGQQLPPGFPAPDPDAPSVFTALQEQLGMKLESAKAPVEMTVIDSIEHPTED